VAFLVLALALFLHASGPALRDPEPCPGVTGYTCSTLDVPLDRTGRQKVTLHLRVGAADNVNAPHGVLLVLSGGPGQPGLPILDRFVDAALAAEKRTYRIVVFDQRGTGAGALDCRAMQLQMGSSDLYPPTAAAVRACAAKIGGRRQFYGTDDVVADIDALRRALGVERIALDGISYGTYVGERTRSPIRITCRSSSSTRSCRTWGSPISASSSSTAPRASSGASAGIVA
jgi:hypothetical protein